MKRIQFAEMELFVEAAHQHTLAQNVAIDGRQDVRTRGIRSQAEFCIQSEKFKRVVMIRAYRRGSRSKKADRSAAILGLHGSVGQHRSGGHTFGKSGSGPGD